MLGHGYRVYFKHILPAIGTLLSGVRGPYAYLPASVERFPSPDEMLGRMPVSYTHLDVYKRQLVICSDGLWGLVRDSEILDAVEDKSAEQAGRELIELARQRGGPDNITVEILRLH